MHLSPRTAGISCKIVNTPRKIHASGIAREDRTPIDPGRRALRNAYAIHQRKAFVGSVDLSGALRNIRHTHVTRGRGKVTGQTRGILALKDFQVRIFILPQNWWRVGQNAVFGVANRKPTLKRLDGKRPPSIRDHPMQGRWQKLARHPLVGDGKYGKNRFDKRFGYKYQALCSYKLRFNFSEKSETALDYLSGKEFSIPKNDIYFTKDYFGR